MNDLQNVSVGVYAQGYLISSYVVGDISYADAEELELQLQRDFPGCDVYVSE